MALVLLKPLRSRMRSRSPQGVVGVFPADL
jgi:hypothetical protein